MKSCKCGKDQSLEHSDSPALPAHVAAVARMVGCAHDQATSGTKKSPLNCLINTPNLGTNWANY